MKTLFKVSTAAIALMLAPAAASAAILSVSGAITTSDPTFHRPGFGTPPTTVSASNFYYDFYTFTVSTNGLYSGTLTSPSFDNVLGLYQGTFDPSAPLTNALIYDDDSGPGVDAYFEYNLAAGQQYTAVVTHYYGIGSTSANTGSYTLAFDGAGTVDAGAVPEPATWAMMMLGFGAMGAALRRRPKVTARVHYA